MSRHKQLQKNEKIFTQVIPVIACADIEQVEKIMFLCGVPRALTYNKLGSVQGWGLDWKKADPIVRTMLQPANIGLPAKLWEWAVNDSMKAITAAQEAAKIFIIRAIYRLTDDKLKRSRLINLLRDDPTSDNWLHRQFRKFYHRGHTFVRNQIVYQSKGYTCRRLTRNTVQLEIAGLEKGKRIKIKLKCRHILKGQIRVIKNEFDKLEIHTIRRIEQIVPIEPPTRQIGIDKGYTEAFFTSDGVEIAAGLGKLMTAKTNRITRINRNRYRLRSYAANHPEQAETIIRHNLGYKVKSRRLAQEKATIKNFIRKDLRRAIASPTVIFAEDLTQPIKGKHQAKDINRKFNQWMKGELQDSLEAVAKETGSSVITVNPAYTSQMCSQTGTLLGSRHGDRFTCYTGVVLHADINAGVNILHRGSDSELTRWMKYAEVRKVLIKRTVRYLASIGKTVTEALKLGWLNSKFKAEALGFEAEISLAGVASTVNPSLGGSASIYSRCTDYARKRSSKQQPSEVKPVILDTPIQLELRFE